MQNEPQHIEVNAKDVIEDYSSSDMSDRCDTIYTAFGSHVLSLKDMKYALMQYYCSEVGNGNIRSDRPLPTNPKRPEKGADVESMDKYYKERASYQRADNQNYEAAYAIKRVGEFQVALRVEEAELAKSGEEYDYRKGREWGAYIVTGVIDGAVRDFLGAPEPEAVDEDDVPF